jgi:pimeloyl-ACP methyl ester carboxylesterase
MADSACGSAFGGIPQPWMRANVLRTDGRARKRMFEAFRGREGCDQREVMANDLGTLVAVVNGAEEQFVDLDYVDGVKYGRLWEGKCHRIPDHGHTPFYEGWEAFRPFLEKFVKDCEAS